ncbi:hypothetical protein HUE56_24070 (plasmid) [Azospirillum oryzae]|uniref:Uncharacterized protein n=1 Tax=Azospirillum oryzae TaxID=286727 RepID=A0A6N1AP48_9PROT|nr:hypothetical protein [Azospirillum oryzae]KAA0586362.1 hypothetical protein FZ938_22050 [Azospirillum oryzae]QKS53575.1 hypothetical protein HUE56_24070 [Azospirillum oryzae]GLR81496.1 hypothetical protein GCM10007856_41840 [Azospirillum oryzae]
MDYELSCYITLSSAPEHGEAREKLIKAVNTFETDLRQAGIGYALDLQNIRQARTVIHSVHAGTEMRRAAAEPDEDTPLGGHE